MNRDAHKGLTLHQARPIKSGAESPSPSLIPLSLPSPLPHHPPIQWLTRLLAVTLTNSFSCSLTNSSTDTFSHHYPFPDSSFTNLVTQTAHHDEESNEGLQYPHSPHGLHRCYVGSDIQVACEWLEVGCEIGSFSEHLLERG